MSSQANDRGIWGDGFVDDDLSAARSVADWSLIDRDEYLRLFPALVPADGRVPAPILAALAADVVRGTAQGSGLSCPATRASRIATFPFCWSLDSASTNEAARDGLAFLTGVLAAAEAGPLGAVARSVTARFAFLSGIHPAYLWPSALADHERDAAAGWLGIVARGRPALMPMPVADVLLDLIETSSGRPVAMRDSQMAGFVRAAIDLDTLLRAAQARRAGRSPVIRRAQPLPWHVGALIAQRPRAVRHWYAARVSLMRRV